MREEGAGLWESVFSANCNISVSYPDILLRPGKSCIDGDIRDGVDIEWSVSYPDILLRPGGSCTDEMRAGVNTDWCVSYLLRPSGLCADEEMRAGVVNRPRALGLGGERDDVMLNEGSECWCVGWELLEWDCRRFRGGVKGVIISSSSVSGLP